MPKNRLRIIQIPQREICERKIPIDVILQDVQFQQFSEIIIVFLVQFCFFLLDILCRIFETDNRLSGVAVFQGLNGIPDYFVNFRCAAMSINAGEIVST